MGAQFHLFGESLPTDATVVGFDVREGLLLPYAVEVEFKTQDTAFRVESCLQQRLLLEVRDGDDQTRYFDGLPDRVGFVAAKLPDLFFKVRLRPRLAALEHRKGCRIFQDKSPVDVIKQILTDAGVDEDVEWRLNATYEPREFLCQYRETELNFLHRLCEEEGIYYLFHHTADGHKLIFGDNPSAFSAQDGIEPVTLSVSRGAGSRPLLDFERQKTLRPTLVCLRDYDFEQPDVLPEAAVPAPGSYAIEHFQYPGGFTKSGEGARRAAAVISGLRGDVDVCRGRSRAAGLVAGTPMTVEGAHEDFLNGEFIVTDLDSRGRLGGAENEADGESAANESSGGDAALLENRFQAIPKDVAFALPRRADKVKIRGIQTAVVTGAADDPQSIHVDEFGRIKVRFFWDRAGKQDDTSSCWIRVSQLALGGSMILPRVGWELAVAFTDGDPDRPLVLGRTYNAEEVPPYGLPGAAADCSFKSMSSPGGAGSNELKTGDSAGGQGMSISSQKDLNVSSGNDKNETIGVDEEQSVGANLKIVIGSSETTKIGANQELNVGNAFQVKVKGAQSVKVGGNDDTHAKADFVESVGGARDYKVSGNQITISCGVRTDVKAAFKRKVGAVHANVSLASIDDNMLSTYDEDVGAVIAQLAAGPVAESVTGNKKATSLAAELHMVGAMGTSAKGVKQLVGGVSLKKCGGDHVVQASTIVIAGGVGKFHGGGSKVELMGGPVTLKGSTIAIDAAAIIKRGASLKIG